MSEATNEARSGDRSSAMTSNRQPREPAAQTYCLLIDLIGSTRASLSLRSWEAEQFNTAFVEHIVPHATALGLEHAVVKFTGDGWLVMSRTAVRELCCLALIFRDSFQHEMAALSGLAISAVPPVRAVLCSGVDVEVQVFGGQKDYVGDSARRANRASGYCRDGELLASASVVEWLGRDFEINPDDIAKARPRPPKCEEDASLFIVNGIKSDAAAKSNTPAAFVYTLGKTGKVDQSIDAVLDAAQRLADLPEVEVAPAPPTAKSVPLTPRRSGPRRTPLRPPAVAWNRAFASLPDYNAALRVLTILRGKGLPRDVRTYTILASKAATYKLAVNARVLMASDGIPPNTEFFNTLMGKAKTYEKARSLAADMRASGVPLDAATYTTLISRTKSPIETEHLVAEFKASRLLPNVYFYNALLSRAKDYEGTQRIFKEMKANGVLPDLVTYNTLLNKAAPPAEALRILRDMRAAELSPDLYTYNTLVKHAQTSADAWSLVYQMKAAGVAPDAITYNTLINKTETFDQARQIINEMNGAGVMPTMETITSAFSKDMRHETARDLLDWYSRQPYHASHPLNSLLATFSRAGRIADALEIALDHPHLSSARKLFSDRPDEARKYFEQVEAERADCPTLDFAFGALYLTTGEQEAAKRRLEKALASVPHLNQKTTIRKWLETL